MSRSTSRNILFVLIVATLALIAAHVRPPSPKPSPWSKLLRSKKKLLLRSKKKLLLRSKKRLPVEKEVIVEKEVPVEKEIVTIAYNGYFDKTFGPADTPIDVITRRSGQKVSQYRGCIQHHAL